MDHSSSVERALDVLFHLHQSREACGVTAIGRALSLPKSTTHRLLSSLAERALVERDDAGRYRPGIGLVALGLGTLAREPLIAAARPVLEHEAAALQETVFLVAARARKLLVLDKVEGTGVLRASPRVGTTVPAHATAVGRLYLALAPEEVSVGRRIRYTARTLITAPRLAAEVETTRQRGYAVSCEEWIEGLSVVAAPVLVGQRLVGALAVGVPAARLERLGEAHVGRQTQRAATQVAQALAGEWS